MEAGTNPLTSPDWTRFGGGVIETHFSYTTVGSDQFRQVVPSFLEVGELVFSGLLDPSRLGSLISSNFDLSVNFSLEPNTISVSIGDLVFPTTAAPWDGVTNWASFNYVRPEPVTMTVRLQNIPSSDSAPYLWFMEIMQGNMLYYDLHLTAGLGNELEYQFVHCLPTSYDGGSPTVGIKVAAAVETLTISCERVEFNTLVRKGFFDWLTEHQQVSSSAERDVFVEFFDDIGNSLMGNNYQGTFISSYRFPRFDKGSSAPLSDAVRLKADSVLPN